MTGLEALFYLVIWTGAMCFLGITGVLIYEIIKSYLKMLKK